VSTTLDRTTQRLLRDTAPQVLGILTRRYRDFSAVEDALQEALIAAAAQWPSEGVPHNPRAWLLHVATRRLTDQIRAEAARRRREAHVVSLIPDTLQLTLLDDEPKPEDDALELLFLSCHPALTQSSAIALTLRAVGGLTTREIASAFLVPEATMAQRISRAKQTLKTEGASFAELTASERALRVPAVAHVLYLIFNEGYAASTGDELIRLDLSNEALRLGRMLHERLPDDSEVAGLFALLLLTDARRRARTGPAGELIPLDEQDRSLWDRAAIAEGVALVTEHLPKAHGEYLMQAAIAAVHDRAPSTDETDWEDILGLYGVLLLRGDNPMVALNHAIALAMVQGPRAGLARLDELARDPRLAEHYRLQAVKGHLLERAGDLAGAMTCYRLAASLTSSTAERDYLFGRVARIEARAS
jgi:RNA polymerase sigma factor (sigma-70 family)